MSTQKPPIITADQKLTALAEAHRRLLDDARLEGYKLGEKEGFQKGLVEGLHRQARGEALVK